MLYSTLQTIRERAGLQNYVIDSPLRITGDSSVFLTKNLDLERIAPMQRNGATLATIVDVNVKVNGATIGVSAIDIVGGYITLATGTSSGASVIATYASSPLTSSQVYQFATEAHSMIESYVSKRYDLSTISGACIPLLADMETKMAVGNILQSSYGVSGQDSSEDGYRLLQDTLTLLQSISNGDLDLIDINGVAVPPNTSGTIGSANMAGSGARVQGYIFTLADERFKLTQPEDL